MRENPGFGSRTQLKHDTVDAAAPISHIICGYPASGGHLDFCVYRVLIHPPRPRGESIILYIYRVL